MFFSERALWPEQLYKILESKLHGVKQSLVNLLVSTAASRAETNPKLHTRLTRKAGPVYSFSINESSQIELRSPIYLL